MHWFRRVLLTTNMNNMKPRKGKKGQVSHPPRSKSTNANPPHLLTRTLKSHSTSAMDSKSDLVDSMRNLNISRNRIRSAVRIPVRSTSTSTGACQSLEDICRFIHSNQVRNVVIMAGAGISTASGIPDFRTPGSGLYDNLHQYKIPYPEAIFDIDYFHYNPRPFFTLAKELYPSGQYRPNAAHQFCRLLYDKGMLLRMYTQNIDGLERIAGIPANKLVEAHGTFSTATCVQCRRKYDGEEIKHEILSGKMPMCRSTLSCSGIIKPDIVFFGEELPKRFWYYLKDFPQCDMLIIMGTSLEVEPFAGIVDYVRFPVPRVLFNLKAVGPFKKRRRMNDVAIKGDLVKNIQLFVNALGWRNEFEQLTGQSLVLESSSDDNESETRTDDQNSNPDKKSPAKAEIIYPLKRNETPIRNNRMDKFQNGHQPSVNGTKSSPASSTTNDNSDTPSRKLHSVSARNDRLLTKRGSANSFLQQNKPVSQATPTRPIFPKLRPQQRVDAYKETLAKLRRWRMDSTTSESDNSSSVDSSDSDTD